MKTRTNILRPWKPFESSSEPPARDVLVVRRFSNAKDVEQLKKDKLTIEPEKNAKPKDELDKDDMKNVVNDEQSSIHQDDLDENGNEIKSDEASGSANDDSTEASREERSSAEIVDAQDSPRCYGSNAVENKAALDDFNLQSTGQDTTLIKRSSIEVIIKGDSAHANDSDTSDAETDNSDQSSNVDRNYDKISDAVDGNYASAMMQPSLNNNDPSLQAAAVEDSVEDELLSSSTNNMYKELEHHQVPEDDLKASKDEDRESLDDWEIVENVGDEVKQEAKGSRSNSSDSSVSDAGKLLDHESKIDESPKTEEQPNNKSTNRNSTTSATVEQVETTPKEKSATNSVNRIDVIHDDKQDNLLHLPGITSVGGAGGKVSLASKLKNRSLRSKRKNKDSTRLGISHLKEYIEKALGRVKFSNF